MQKFRDLARVVRPSGARVDREDRCTESGSRKFLPWSSHYRRLCRISGNCVGMMSNKRIRVPWYIAARQAMVSGGDGRLIPNKGSVYTIESGRVGDNFWLES